MVPMAGRLSIVVTTICKQDHQEHAAIGLGGPAWLLCRMRNFRHSDGRVGRRIDARDVTLQSLSSLRAVRSTHEDRLTDEGKASAEVLVCANLERRHDSRPNHRDAEGSRGFHLPRSAGCGFWPVAELACCTRWAVDRDGGLAVVGFVTVGDVASQRDPALAERIGTTAAFDAVEQLSPSPRRI